MQADSAAARRRNIESISTNSRGVDSVLLRNNEPLLTAPYHDRDARTDAAMERAFAVVPAEEIFAQTGIPFMPVNMLHQLLADQRARPWALTTATRFLHIAGYFNWLLRGVAKAEESLAGTTQLYDPRHSCWSERLIRGLKLPRLFPEIVASGKTLGPLLPALAEEIGLREMQVLAGCWHDTACAVAAVPAKGHGWPYVSSGTWSLTGLEYPVAVITEKSLRHNRTSEVGFRGSIGFLKNIAGLWIQQQCRRAWERKDNVSSYELLENLAGTAPALRSLIHPNDPRFAKSGHMPEKIAVYCRQTDQPPADAPGAFIRCALESLALLYRRTLDELEDVTGKPLKTLYIVGGGSNSQRLNQLSANATGRTVVAGPAEATAAGNVLIQAIARGQLKDLEALHAVVRNPFEVKTHKPKDAGSGPGGRVVEKDVRAYLDAKGYDKRRVSPAAKKLAAQEQIGLLSIPAGRIEVADVRQAIAEKPKPTSKMRQVITRRLQQSVVTAPHFYGTVAADMTDLLALRQRPLTVADFVAEAVVLALKGIPTGPQHDRRQDDPLAQPRPSRSGGIAGTGVGRAGRSQRRRDDAGRTQRRLESAGRESARRQARRRRDDRQHLYHLQHGHAGRGEPYRHHQPRRKRHPRCVQHAENTGRAR